MFRLEVQDASHLEVHAVSECACLVHCIVRQASTIFEVTAGVMIRHSNLTSHLTSGSAIRHTAHACPPHTKGTMKEHPLLASCQKSRGEFVAASGCISAQPSMPPPPAILEDYSRPLDVPSCAPQSRAAHCAAHHPPPATIHGTWPLPAPAPPPGERAMTWLQIGVHM